MSKALKLLLLILLPPTVFSQHYNQDASFLDHMTQVNIQWNKYSKVAPQATTSFLSEADRIAAHLQLVSEYLVASTSVSLTQEQRQHRIQLLDALEKYAENRIFPMNSQHLQRTPYFVDYRDVHCAVGYLMAYSGEDELVQKIRAEHNYDYIKDIRTEGVADWANTHGFTVDELEWIQPGYPSNTVIDPLEGGANGTVNIVKQNTYLGELIIAGSFDSLNYLPCLGIGVYENEQLSCLGNGIEGQINAITFGTNGEVIVAGALVDNGTTYPLAIYSGSNWIFLSIPTRDGAVATACNFFGGNLPVEIVIDHPTLSNKQEVWFRDSNGTWTRKAEVNGWVKAIESSSLGRVYMGHFDTVSRFNSTGLIDSVIPANNVAFFTNNYTVWNGLMEANLPDTVNDFQAVGNAYYFAGECSVTQGSGVCVARWMNNTIQPIVLASNFSAPAHPGIRALETNVTHNKLILGGEFEINAMFGTFGYNLASFDLASNSLSAEALLNGGVHTISKWNTKLYIGGAFTQSSGYPLSHLGQFEGNVSLEEYEQEEIDIFPNPFSDWLEVKGIEGEGIYRIYDIQGKLVMEGALEQHQIRHLDRLKSGKYIVKIIADNRMISRELSK